MMFNTAKLVSERRRTKLSLLDVAKRLRSIEPKASKNLVWNWERGTQPCTKYVYAIAQIFDKDVSYFLKNTGQKKAAKRGV